MCSYFRLLPQEVGTWQDGMTVKCCATTRESAAWLPTRPNDYQQSHYWSDTIQSICPKEAYDLVEGTYDHIVDPAYAFADVTPAIYFQLSEVENGRYDVRFISGIANIEDPTRVGFDITIHVGGKSYKLAPEYTLSKTAYTSVLAAGNTVEAKDLNEAYDYLFTCAITGIKATDNIIIDVAVVYECEDVTLTGATVSYSFVCGTGHIN